MSDVPATPSPSARYRLDTFGTLALERDGETILGGHGHHRRRLALLAVLAAAGERGRSRDQLLALFWPEATQARARHSLDQLLYALRSTLGEGLFGSRDPVRLDPDVLESDVQAFDAALDADDPAAAVALYRGAFLDGFYLGDALEFERWLDAERSRLEQRYTAALGRLAERAESAGDHSAAVAWRRRLADADPLSAKGASGLIRALKNAGDHAAALKYAERYEALVAQELGTRAGPDVARLVAEVRAEAMVTAAPPADAVAPRADLGRVDPIELPAGTIPVGRPVAAPARRRRPMRAIGAGMAVLAAIALVAFAGRRFGEREAAARVADPAVVVVPFRSVGGDRRDSLLVEGIGNELTTALARIERLRVVSRDSRLAPQGAGGDPSRVASRVGATHAVVGDVRWDGPRLGITVRLVDAKGVTRWSESYERQREEVFLVQSDIAMAVARELGLSIAPVAMRAIRRPLTRNIAAYELFLRGRDPVAFRSPTDSGPRAALADLQQAVKLDPEFAAAYATMPYMYAQMAFRTTDNARVPEYRRMVDSMARKALALDPMLPEAHTGMAVSYLMGFRNLYAAELELRRAIALGGSPRVHEHLANILMLTGRQQEALAEAMRSAQEDPLSVTAAAELGKMLCLNGRYEEGLATMAPVASVKPPLQRLRGHMALCHVRRGDWRKAREVLGATDQRHITFLQAWVAARMGDTAMAQAARRQMIARQPVDRNAYDIAAVSAALGDEDAAFEWLDRAREDLSVNFMLQFPTFDHLRDDPRWTQFLEKSGYQKR